MKMCWRLLWCKMLRGRRRSLRTAGMPLIFSFLCRHREYQQYLVSTHGFIRTGTLPISTRTLVDGWGILWVRVRVWVWIPEGIPMPLPKCGVAECVAFGVSPITSIVFSFGMDSDWCFLIASSTIGSLHHLFSRENWNKIVYLARKHLQESVDNLHRLISFILEYFTKRPHQYIHTTPRYKELRISKSSGERVCGTSPNGVFILGVIWVG